LGQTNEAVDRQDHRRGRPQFLEPFRKSHKKKATCRKEIQKKNRDQDWGERAVGMDNLSELKGEKKDLLGNKKNRGKVYQGSAQGMSREEREWEFFLQGERAVTNTFVTLGGEDDTEIWIKGEGGLKDIFQEIEGGRNTSLISFWKEEASLNSRKKRERPYKQKANGGGAAGWSLRKELCDRIGKGDGKGARVQLRGKNTWGLGINSPFG